jgi:hypothetical protein
MEQPLPELNVKAKALDQKTKIIFIFLMFLPCFLVHSELDNDIWFLLSSGRYVLQHGIPYIEPLTMHQNMHFVMQQWLSAVLFWGVYSKLGAVGLIVLVFLVYVCIVTVSYRLNCLISGKNHISAFLATFFTSVLLSMFMTTRPMIFTFFILFLEMYVLERYIATGKAVYLIPLPFLSALSVNLHAAMWLFQYVLLVPYVIDSFRFQISTVKGQGYRKSYLLIAIGCMLAAGFINPYGLGAMTYLFRSYGYTEIGFVNEMMPANINTALGAVIFGTFLIVGAVYFLYKKGTIRIRYILLTLGTAFLALSSTRSFALFIVCGLFPLSYFLKDIRLPKSKKEPKKNTRWIRIVLLTLVMLELVYVFGGRINTLFKSNMEPDVAGAVNYLVKNEDTDHMVLYTGYDDGGYAEFVGLKPFIDPRAEVFVEKNNHVADIMKEYCLMEIGRIYYKDVLDKYQFTHLVVSQTDLITTYLAHDSDYEKIYDDTLFAVYKKR